MDLTTIRLKHADPISVEMAIAQMERSVDYHLQQFLHNATVQPLASELKLRFRKGIEADVPYSTK